MSLTTPRRALAAGLGGYVGINAAALCAPIEFGLQPTLFHSSSGTPLYAPFDLGQTIPAMALAHLTIAGFVEFVLTFAILGYLQRANLPLMRFNHPRPPRTRRQGSSTPRERAQVARGMGARRDLALAARDDVSARAAGVPRHLNPSTSSSRSTACISRCG